MKINICRNAKEKYDRKISKPPFEQGSVFSTPDKTIDKCSTVK